MSLKLMYITNIPEVAKIAENSGVQATPVPPLTKALMLLPRILIQQRILKSRRQTPQQKLQRNPRHPAPTHLSPVPPPGRL